MKADEFNKYINKLIASGAEIREVGENYEVSFTVLNGDWEDDVFITFPKTVKINNSSEKDYQYDGA